MLWIFFSRSESWKGRRLFKQRNTLHEEKVNTKCMGTHVGKNEICGTNIQSVPLATEPGWLADRCSVSQQLGALQTHTTDTHYSHTLQTHTTDTFLFISHTMNVLLFKFRCNIFIGVRIIKEMPDSVASGTHCIVHHLLMWFWPCIAVNMWK